MRRNLLSTIIAILPITLLTAPALAGIAIEELPFADGRRALVYDGKVYLPDHTGLLKLAPVGRYELKGGVGLSVQAGGKFHQPHLVKRFDPQPEPPGISLRGVLASGQEILLAGQKVFLIEEGTRRSCPDGVYRLGLGVSLQVRGGRLTSLSSLEGLVLVGAAEARH